MVELHFHDSEFTLLGKSVEGEVDEGATTGTDDEAATEAGPPEESDGGNVGAALVALVVLVVVAFVVRRVLADGDDGVAVPETDVESGV